MFYILFFYIQIQFQKCYYWPKINPLTFDGLCIRLKMEDKASAYCTIRKFVLTKEDEGDSVGWINGVGLANYLKIQILSEKL